MKTHFAPLDRNYGKSIWNRDRANAALVAGQRVALAQRHGLCIVPDGYRVEHTSADASLLRTPEGMLVIYRLKEREYPWQSILTAS